MYLKEIFTISYSFLITTSLITTSLITTSLITTSLITTSLITTSLITTRCFAADPLPVNNVDSTTLTPINVSADFRPSIARETPVSISTVSKEVIESRAAQHLEDVINLAPNVNSSSGASRGRYFQIRGIGERSQFETPINPSVGLIIDGIDFSHTGGAATLFDIEQVEILHGPQGTRYGASALAGLINLRSTQPSDDLDIHFESSLAEYNTRSIGLAVGGPLIEDSLLGRLSIHKHDSDGYMNNVFLNRDDTNGRDELTARGHLQWLASDDLTFDLNVLHLNIDNGYDAFTFNNSRNTFSDQPGHDKQTTNSFSLKTNWHTNNAFRMESNLSYSASDLEYSFDEDWSFVGQFPLSFFPYSSFDQYNRDRKNHSVELRFLSNENGRLFNGRSDWVAGIYYADQNENLDRQYTFLSSDFSSEYETENIALYGQLDTAITDQLILITGLRVENWTADYRDSNNAIIESDEVLFGGKLGLNYHLNDQHMIYSSLSRGYKAGGVNAAQTLPVNARDFGTEYLWNLEAGIKSSWLDGAINSSLTLFYAQRKNQQVNSSILTPVPGGGGATTFTGFIANAAKGKNIGLEAELDWQVNYNWRLFANLGLLKATFDEYDDPQGLANGVDLSGRRQAHAPDYQFAAGTEYHPASGWTLRANVEGKDEFFFSDRHNARSNSYALVNTSIEYQHQSWKVSLWARNLFDRDYSVRGFGSFGNNPGNGYITETYTQRGEPRIVGLSFSWDY